MTDKNKLGNFLDKITMTFMVFIINLLIMLVTTSFFFAITINNIPLTVEMIYNIYIPVIIFGAIILTIVDWIKER